MKLFKKYFPVLLFISSFLWMGKVILIMVILILVIFTLGRFLLLKI